MEIREFRMADYAEVVALWARAGLLAGRSDEPGEIEKKLAIIPQKSVVGSSKQAGDGRQNAKTPTIARPMMAR